jgi:diamine N-acetyltransferase
MERQPPTDAAPPAVTLVPVDAGNWRAVADLEVAADQASYVAPVTRYLAMCAYDDGPWEPLAVVADGDAVGFVMKGTDPEDGSLWIGGLLVAEAHQGHGYGRAAVLSLVEEARAGGSSSVALSYEPENTRARDLYARLGFRETGEQEGDEVIARLSLG